MNFTQIGSLPFENIDEALNYSFEHSIPFVPDLPAITSREFMLEQASHSQERIYQQVALKLFLERSRDYDHCSAQGFDTWKNQLPGPHALMTHLNWSWGKACDVFKAMLDHRIESFLGFNDQKKIWIFIDEPSFSNCTPDKTEALFSLLASYHSQGLFLAIHYCGAKSIDFNNWDNRVGLSYDSELHPNLILPQVPTIIGGDWKRGDKPVRPRFTLAITPSCGLWGHTDPESVLLALKSHCAR